MIKPELLAACGLTVVMPAGNGRETGTAVGDDQYKRPATADPLPKMNQGAVPETPPSLYAVRAPPPTGLNQLPSVVQDAFTTWLNTLPVSSTLKQ